MRHTVSHPARRQELLEVLRKEPRSTYELIVVKRVCSKTEAEVKAEAEALSQ